MKHAYLPLITLLASAAPLVSADTAAILDSEDRTVSFVSVEQPTIVATTQVDGEPTAVAASQELGDFFVTSRNPGLLHRVSMDGTEVFLPAKIGGSPIAVLLDESRFHVFIADADQDRLIVVEADRFDILQEIPLPDKPDSMALSRSREWLAVAHGETISVYHASRFEKVAEFAALPGPLKLKFSPDDALYALSTEAERVVIYDTKDWQQSAEIRLGKLPVAMDFLGNDLMVSERGSEVLRLYRRDGKGQVTTLATGYRADTIAASSDGRTVVALDSDSGRTHLFDLRTGHRIARFRTGPAPLTGGRFVRPD